MPARGARMRKSTAAWLSLAALCGALLFRTSQMTTDGAARLAGLEAATARERESVRVLSAEWGYLNAPDRLEKLARAHLDLEPMRGGQFAQAGALEARPAAPEPEPKPAPEKAAGKQEDKPEVSILKSEAPEARPVLPAPRKAVAAKKAQPPPRTASRAPEFPRYVPPGYGARRAATQPVYNHKPAYNLKLPPAYAPKASAAPAPKAPPASAPKAPQQQQPQKRGFGDLMKSLGAD